jgi:hypothetical protein
MDQIDYEIWSCIYSSFGQPENMRTLIHFVFQVKEKNLLFVSTLMCS